MIISSRQRTGRRGEELAVAYLQREGLTILDRNCRVRCGEIDIVARDGQEVVFVEVRTRASSSFGTPEESITSRKRHSLVDCAMAYLQDFEPEAAAWRIDLIAIVLERERVRRLDHYRHVIQ